MKILLLTLMLTLLVGCSSKEIAMKPTDPPVPVSEEETAHETTEVPEQEIEETAEATETADPTDTVLDEAAAFAEDADYADAIVLLQDAMKEDPGNAAYRDAYAEYCEAYKAQTIASAEELATAEDYLGAIRLINGATALIGSDAELSQLGQDYAEAHVSAQTKHREETEPPEEESVSEESPEAAVAPEEEPAEPEVSETPEETETESQSSHAPFYGIWCFAATSAGEAEQFAATLAELGFEGQVFVTTEWSNLNQNESWYVVTAGVYASQGEADAMLSSVRSAYPDAYVKYSGNWKG